MASNIVVSDTTAITHLAKIGALDLLSRLYVTLYIPDAVYNELTAHGNNIPGCREVQSYSWIIRKTVNNRPRVKACLEYLDLGESEAIALAEEMNADLLIIDEVKGRQYAKSIPLPITGMVGILVQAKKKKLIPSVKYYLDRLIATKFNLGEKLYQQALELAGEKEVVKKV